MILSVTAVADRKSILVDHHMSQYKLTRKAEVRIGIGQSAVFSLYMVYSGRMNWAQAIMWVGFVIGLRIVAMILFDIFGPLFGLMVPRYMLVLP